MAKEEEVKLEEKENLFKIKISSEIPNLPEYNEKVAVDVRYPLVEPYAYVHIYWDSASSELFYELEEPKLDENEKGVLDILEGGIKELINITFINVKDQNSVISYLERNLMVLLTELGIKLEEDSFLKIMYYIWRDFVGLNEIEPLMRDYFIEDIECNGVDTPIYIVHRKYRNLRTNIIYKDVKGLTGFVEKLAQKCGKYVSYASPLLDAQLPDGSRINATYTGDISSRGPTFCIADGYLQLSNGVFKKIDKFFDECKETFGSKIEDNNEVVEVVNLGCCGVDEKSLEQKDSRIKTIIKLKPPEKLVCVELEDGSEITVTTNHKFHIVDNKLSLIEAENLREGMFIPIPTKINVNGYQQKINTYNLIKDFSYIKKVFVISNGIIRNVVGNEISSFKDSKGFYRQKISEEFGVHNSYFYEIISRGCSISFEVLDKICTIRGYDFGDLGEVSLIMYGGGTKNRTKGIKVPSIVDEELAYLTGVLISDGHLSKGYLDISCYDLNIKERVKDILEEKFGFYNSYYNDTRVYLCNIFVPYFFNRLFEIPIGHKTYSVKVPEIISKSDNKTIASFIKGLFDGDGTCKSGLSYKSYSKELVYGLTYLLARLGIYSYIRETDFANKTEYKLNIPSIYYQKYLDLIGFESKEKLHYLKRLISKQIDHKTNIRYGRIPSKIILELMGKLKLSKLEVSEKVNVGYNRFYYETYSKTFVRRFLDLIKDKKGVRKEVEFIGWMLNSNQEFVRVKNVKIFDNTDRKPVYDIELEPCKFFIAGNKPMNVFDTIRKFTKEPWSPVRLMQMGTVSPELLAYLWLLIEYESNIMVIGGTGSGKCVTGDTIIHLANGKLIEIKDLVESKFDKNRIIKNNGWEYVSGDGVSVLSLDINTLKIKKRPINKLWRHKAPKKLVKIITRAGRDVTVTPEHPFFKCEDGNLVKIRADKLNINERIAVPRILPIENKKYNKLLINYLKNEKEIYVYKEFNKIKKISNILSKKYNCNRKVIAKKLNYAYGTFRSWHDKNAIPLKEYIKLMEEAGLNLEDKLKLKAKTAPQLCKLPKLSPKLFRFIALLISDGHLTKNRTEFYNSNKLLLREFLKLGKDLFSLNGNIKHYEDRTSKSVIHSSVLSKILNKVFQVPYGNKARKVIVPEILFRQNNKSISEFLSGVIDCEGYIGKEYIEISSTSKKFSRDLIILFLRLGILARFIERKNHCRINLYSYDNIKRLNSLVKIKKPDKLISLNKLLNRSLAHTTVNLDIIPNLSNFIKNTRLDLDMTQTNFADGADVSRRLVGMWEYGLRNPTRDTLNQFADFIEIPKFKTLANSDIFWEEIIDIKIIKKHNEKYVYDLTIDEDHNFIAGDIPFIIHNTSFLNGLAFFVPPQARVVSIEDTRELNLLHENWLPSVARAGVGFTSITGERHGEISLFDLLKESFRQRPDYVIVGEVRGKEAFVLFQGMASIKGSEEIFIVKDGKPLRTKIENIKDIKDCYAITYDLNKKENKLIPIKAFIRHPKRNILYKITTKTGREVTITPNHSVFTYKNNEIKTITADNLKIGNKLVIPSRLPSGFCDIEYINLLEFLPNIRVYAPRLIKEAVSKISYKIACTCCGVKSISDYYSNFKKSRSSALRADKFLKLMNKADLNYSLDEISVRFDRKSESSPVRLKLTNEFLRLLGYYLSEGSLDIGKKSNRISLYSKDKKILNDMEQCIIKVSGKDPRERVTYGYGKCVELSFNHKVIYEFLKEHCGRKYDKKAPDFIFGLSKEKIGQFLSALYDGDGHLGNAFGYYTISKKLASGVAQLLLTLGIVARINKRNRKGRKTTDYEILFYSAKNKNEFLKYVKPLSKRADKILLVKRDKKQLGDLYIDKIKSIEPIKLDKKEYVYDICVPETQNFVGGFGSIILHNSGHPSFGTMHAENVDTLIKRLETPPISLSPALVSALDVVCIMAQVKVEGKPSRKVREVVEVVNVTEQGAVTNTPFVWNPRNNKFFFKTHSKIFDKIIIHHGLTNEALWQEFKRRTALLYKMYKYNISGYKEVHEIIKIYYKTPERVLTKFGIK